nr:hypothetical protein [Sunxiuqinia sp.]
MITALGGIKEIVSANKKPLTQVPKIGSITAQKILESNVLDRVETEVEFVRKNEIQTAFYWDDH